MANPLPGMPQPGLPSRTHILRHPDMPRAAFARPLGQSDEMVIAAAAGSPLQRVEDLRPGLCIALTDSRDIRLIGLRLLEAADLSERGRPGAGAHRPGPAMRRCWRRWACPVASRPCRPRTPSSWST